MRAPRGCADCSLAKPDVRELGGCAEVTHPPKLPSSLRRRLYAFAALDEFGPLLALFTLWFADVGVTVLETSAVFTVWAIVAVLLEVPSGALADRVDRRRLLSGALGLRAAGFVVWLVWPSYAGMLVGAVLWAVQGAAASGAWEALVYDELEAVDAADAYARTAARLGQLRDLGIAASALLATGLLTWGVPLEALGWATVGLQVFPAALVLSLPKVSPSEEEDDDEDTPSSYGAWWSTLRRGVGAIRSDGQLARLVVLGAFLEGLFIVDEYIPLVARDRGASDAAVPWFVLVVWCGLLLGGEIALRRASMNARSVGGLLAAGAVALLVALWTSALWTLVLVGFGVAAMHATAVLSDARFQALLPSATRATSTSVRALFAALVNAGVFAWVGACAGWWNVSIAVGAAMVGLFPVAAMVLGWLPAHAVQPEPENGTGV